MSKPRVVSRSEDPGMCDCPSPTSFSDRNAGEDKSADSFQPTDDQPIKLRHRLAGMVVRGAKSSAGKPPK